MDKNSNIDEQTLGQKTQNFSKALFVLITLICAVAWFGGNEFAAVCGFFIAFIQSFLMYCFGHALNVMDDNNRLLQNISKTMSENK